MQRVKARAAGRILGAPGSQASRTYDAIRPAQGQASRAALRQGPTRRDPLTRSLTRRLTDYALWPLPLDFSFTHLTRCQRRRGFTFCLWSTVRRSEERRVGKECRGGGGRVHGV